MGKEHELSKLQDYKIAAFRETLKHKFELNPEGARNYGLQKLLEEARKIEKPAEFYAGEGAWFKGIHVGPRRLNFGRVARAKIALEVVFNINIGKFYFCSELVPTQTPQKRQGFELKEIAESRLLFEEGTISQQQELLAATFDKLLRHQGKRR